MWGSQWENYVTINYVLCSVRVVPSRDTEPKANWLYYIVDFHNGHILGYLEAILSKQVVNSVQITSKPSSYAQQSL